MAGEQTVQRGDQRHHAVAAAPVKVVLSVNVDLLRGEPLHAVGDAPRALMAQQRGESDTQARICAASFRKPVVVVRLGEVDERAEPLGASVRRRKVMLELAAVIRLEYLGIRPVQTREVQQSVRNIERSAQALKHEDRVRMLFADSSYDLHPGRLGNHVARVAPEAVNALSAPEQEHAGHVFAQPFMRIVEFDKILPYHAPCAGRYELAVLAAAEPFGMVRLKSARPAGVVRRKVDEETAAAGMHGINQFAELVQRRCGDVEFRHRGIDGVEIGGGERASVLAHYRICGRHGKRRKRLHDPKSHVIHDMRKTPDHFTERPELAGEHRIYRIRRTGRGRSDLHMEIAAVRPFRGL